MNVLARWRRMVHLIPAVFWCTTTYDNPHQPSPKGRRTVASSTRVATWCSPYRGWAPSARRGSPRPTSASTTWGWPGDRVEMRWWDTETGVMRGCPPRRCRRRKQWRSYETHEKADWEHRRTGQKMSSLLCKCMVLVPQIQVFQDIQTGSCCQSPVPDQGESCHVGKHDQNPNSFGQPGGLS